MHQKSTQLPRMEIYNIYTEGTITKGVAGMRSMIMKEGTKAFTGNIQKRKRE